MAAVILEKFDSREFTDSEENPTFTLRYSVFYTEDDLEVRALVEATIPAFVDGLAYQTYHIVPHGGGVWEVDVRYGKLQPKKAGDTTFSFDTTGGSAKITQSISTIGEFSTDLFIDFKGAIGVNDGKPEGIDIIVPKFGFTVTHVFAHPISSEYVQLLYELAGKVNSDTVAIDIKGVVLIFAPGELKYEGATGSQRGEEDWEMTLRFSASKNAENLTFGDIKNVTKRGWDYLWVFYEDEEDTSGDVIIKKPKQVNVEQVFEDAELLILFA